ncbi:interleukin-17 receptor C-like [Suncus etruscus]|uniref:interleukin-17 receptor C-like n=1 Tax=Suncus etruscus TaxID=109475 RepID=UPI00210FD205|nr:interleukin-17 receptor C-like [Suncus etruscus]
MPVPWFLLSLALGRSPGVLSLEKLVGTQDSIRCSPGLSCNLSDNVLCYKGDLVPASGPVLVPTQLRTELVLRCYQNQDCGLCVRVVLPLAVQASVQAQIVLFFQAYPVFRCARLDVEVPVAHAQPGQSVGYVVFECFEAALGSEVHVRAYTRSQYQQELSLMQKLPVLPWINVSVDGDEKQLLLDVPAEQRFGLSLYLNKTQGPPKRLWSRNLTGPQTILLSQQELFPCLCVQVWPLELDAIRTNSCPFQNDPQAYWNFWHAVHVKLLSLTNWRLDAPCSLSAVAELCWQAPGGGPCQSLVPPLSPKSINDSKVFEFPLLEGHPNLCVQLSIWEGPQLLKCLWAGPPRNDMLLVETQGPQDNGSLCALEANGCTSLLSRASLRTRRLGDQILRDLRSGQCLKLWDDHLIVLWACPMDKYVHQRWALVWLACLLLAALLFFLLLLKKDHIKGCLRLLKEDVGGVGGTPRGRAVLLLYSAEGDDHDKEGFEQVVGVLASALARLRMRVAVDLWSRRELSALGPVAWVHAQRRQILQEGGLVVLLFSPSTVALSQEWLLQDGASTSMHTRGPEAAFASSLSCVLPDFQQGRASGCYIGACFDGLLAPEAVPALFRAVPLFTLPSQMPAFLRALQGRGGDAIALPGARRLRASAEHVAHALQPALDRYFRSQRSTSGSARGDPEVGM